MSRPIANLLQPCWKQVSLYGITCKTLIAHQQISMKKIVVVGASGHAKVIVDIIQQENKSKIVGFLDRFQQKGATQFGYPILGSDEDLPELMSAFDISGVVVGIGDNFNRAAVAKRISESIPGISFVAAIHPRASIAHGVSVGEGSVVMAGASINPSCSIGRLCILNTNSSLDHDSVMEDFSSLGPGVSTGGNCQIGQYSAIGIGATLVHNVMIGEHAVIGAGSVVMKSIDSFAVAYGVPARTVRSRLEGDKYL